MAATWGYTQGEWTPPSLLLLVDARGLPASPLLPPLTPDSGQTCCVRLTTAPLLLCHPFAFPCLQTRAASSTSSGLKRVWRRGAWTS